MGEALLLAGQPHQVEGLRHSGKDVVARFTDDLGGQCHVLQDVLVLQKPEVLEDEADLPSQLGHLPRGDLRQVTPQDVDTPLGRTLLAQDQTQEG